MAAAYLKVYGRDDVQGRIARGSSCDRAGTLKCTTPSTLEEDQTRSSSPRSRKRGGGSRNVLGSDAVAAGMEGAAIPGSHVSATTKHGTLTVDEIRATQPGMTPMQGE